MTRNECNECNHITILDWILSPLKLTVVQQKMHSCHGRRHDVICSYQSFVMCGHTIFMTTLPTVERLRHMIR